MSYTKHTWVNGEILDADKMNHLEDGVVAVSANGAIGTANLADNAVTTDKIAAKSVTRAKLSDAVTAELDNKANIDGSYESMTVGNAEQLVSSVGIEDQTPYNFRTSGGSTEIGDREELNAVVGVSVPWNQIYTHSGNRSGSSQNVTITDNMDGSFTLDGTATANGNFVINSTYEIPLPKMHVFYVCGYEAGTGGTGNYLGFAGLRIDNGGGGLWKNTTNYDALGARVDFSSGTVYDNVIIKPQVFDLTAMLGSTIADYIYALEQSNAGAGVAYFRKLFPKPYYAYNSGKLLSVQTSAHKMVGFNLYNKEDAVNGKYIDTNGNEESYNIFSHTGYIKAIPNTVYYVLDVQASSNINMFANYDADKNFIGWSPSYNGDIHLRRTLANTAYVIVNILTSVIDTQCINISWDGERDGEYEAYQSWNYPLDSDLELRGMLKLDANNNLYAYGDRYLPNGTVIRKRRQIVADGDTVKVTEVNQSNGTYWCSLTTLSSANKGVNSTTTETRIITDKGYRDYPVVGVGHIYITNNGIAPIICLFDQTLTTVSAVNTYLASNPITIEYELETPTTETASPYQQTQIVDDFGTEEFVDAAVEANERDVAIPVGNETVYKPNLRAKLEMAPDSPDGDGDYIVRQTNGQNTYIPLVDVKELPDFPSNDGLYKLRCTVTNGTATLSWASDS